MTWTAYDCLRVEDREGREGSKKGGSALPCTQLNLNMMKVNRFKLAWSTSLLSS